MLFHLQPRVSHLLVGRDFLVIYSLLTFDCGPLYLLFRPDSYGVSIFTFFCGQIKPHNFKTQLNINTQQISSEAVLNTVKAMNVSKLCKLCIHGDYFFYSIFFYLIYKQMWTSNHIKCSLCASVSQKNMVLVFLSFLFSSINEIIIFVLFTYIRYPRRSKSIRIQNDWRFW